MCTSLKLCTTHVSFPSCFILGTCCYTLVPVYLPADSARALGTCRQGGRRIFFKIGSKHIQAPLRHRTHGTRQRRHRPAQELGTELPGYKKHRKIYCSFLFERNGMCPEFVVLFTTVGMSVPRNSFSCFYWS